MRVSPVALLLLLWGCGPRTAAPATEPIVFRDTAAEAGLSFRWGHNGKTPLNILATAGGGAGFIDYDSDGKLDIVLIGNTLALFHNEGNGHFLDATANSGLTAKGNLMGCAVGDFDRDGRPDLTITANGDYWLYRNMDGHGRFWDVSTSWFRTPPKGWLTSAGFTDLDGNGFLDLVICRYVKFGSKSRQLCDYPAADGGARVWAACPPLFYAPERILVYRSAPHHMYDGKRDFEDVTNLFPGAHGNSLGLAFADYDDDGRMDAYVANDGLPGDLYHNLGSWKFENVGAASGTGYNQDGREQAGMGVDWGDYDGDGVLDLLVGTFQNEPKSLYRNRGSGLFSYASYLAGIGDPARTRLTFGCGFLDYDNDGKPDILLANGHVQDTIEKIHPPATYAQRLQLFYNKGGVYEEVTGGPAFTKPIVGRALAFGDYDNDGRMDALVADLEGAPVLLHNESKTANHWIGIRVTDSTGKVDSLGARVTVRTRSGVHIGQSQTCRSYLSSSDPRVHFGLGSNEQIWGGASMTSYFRLTVRWPSGKTATLSNPPIDQYVTVKEPSGR